jgi:hypothetical protein
VAIVVVVREGEEDHQQSSGTQDGAHVLNTQKEAKRVDDKKSCNHAAAAEIDNSKTR